jgi:hypothetical protein
VPTSKKSGITGKTGVFGKWIGLTFGSDSRRLAQFETNCRILTSTRDRNGIDFDSYRDNRHDVAICPQAKNIGSKNSAGL